MFTALRVFGLAVVMILSTISSVARQLGGPHFIVAMEQRSTEGVLHLFFTFNTIRSSSNA